MSTNGASVMKNYDFSQEFVTMEGHMATDGYQLLEPVGYATGLPRLVAVNTTRLRTALANTIFP